jgi:S-adenosylmethionine decarboxylase
MESASTLSLNAMVEATDSEGEVFEGPEKKLDVYFSTPSTKDGFRQFSTEIWSDLLVEAQCSILHVKSNSYFDAYLLSESSLFVYPDRVILKTCGTTRLLLVLPKLLFLAKQMDCVVHNVQYGHFRYKFPEQQLYPHASFDEEGAYLASHFSGIRACVLGPPDARCWYMLLSQPHPEKMPAEMQSVETFQRSKGGDVFEVAMEGLSPNVCEIFMSSAYASLSGKALAKRMTSISGIGSLLKEVEIDDWAFQPCGYSMNGLRGQDYYTIHVTPEDGFSYASFETNDERYQDPQLLRALIATFQPSMFTLSLTTRHAESELPTYDLPGYERSCIESIPLSASASVCCINFSSLSSSTLQPKFAASPKQAAVGECGPQDTGKPWDGSDFRLVADIPAF